MPLLPAPAVSSLPPAYLFAPLACRFFLAFFLLPSVGAIAADPEESPSSGKKPDDRYPVASAGADSPASALRNFSTAPGLKVDLWAAEPLLANPVAFCFDEKGRAYVAETYRRRTSVPDIRKFEPWQLENFALRTVEDRKRFIEGKFPVGAGRKPTKDLADFNQDGVFDYTDWGVESERIKLLTDSNGDGVADQATVLATVQATPITGVGAGVAARGGSVYYTCVPEVWRFDGEQNGAATERKALLTGFGVHVAYGGHDMHGTKFGPDGKLYWSIADCGARVTTTEGMVLDCPDSGAVFRCEPDGRNAEIVAIGLRNPQSLAFNDLGDLFTGDNNADGGDKARWTHVVDGADFGWRLGWQFLKKSDIDPQLGAWNGEGMWHLEVSRTNPAVLPPVGLIGHGPAGIAYYPGTGLPEAYREHFFMADFPGGVRAFKLNPHGASYTVDNPRDILQNNAQKEMTGKLLWGLYPSDVEFGVDGGAYVLDWVQGWDKTGKGRIFRVHDPATDASAEVQETKKRLATGMSGLDEEELGRLLAHIDQRVRLAAETELVARGEKTPKDRAIGLLAEVARSGTVKKDGPMAVAEHQKLLRRLHAIWGLGQLLELDKLDEANKASLWTLLSDPTAEVRAQAAKVLSYASATAKSENAAKLVGLLGDPAPRVRFFAAQTLGKLGTKSAVPALFELLRTNADEDPYLRHAAVVALAGLAEKDALLAKAGDSSDAVRTGVLLALRRKASPEIARFLADANPRLALDAARAIHDGAIPAAWPRLAALAEQSGLSDPLVRRALNANFLLGTAEGASRLAKLALLADQPKTAPSGQGAVPAEEASETSAPPISRRMEAIRSLAIWNEPFMRDRITGLWRELPPGRDTEAAVAAGARILPRLLDDADAAIRLGALEMAARLKIQTAEPTLFTVATDRKAEGKIRAAALHALDAVHSPRLGEAVQAALDETDKSLLTAARQLAGQTSPALAVKVNAAVLGKGSLREQQAALAAIGTQSVPEADRVLAAQLELLLKGKLKPGLTLDLLEAAAARQDRAVLEKVAAYEATRPASDPLAKWRECLEGGEAKAGRQLFAEKAEAACMRCHKVKKVGGDVGPDLAGIGQRHDRQYILQSIVDPNAVIAPGYESVVLTMKDSSIVAGLLNAETPTEMTIGSLVDGKKQQVQKAAVKERTSAPSVMPPGLADALGKRGLRDVVEYLATVK